VKVAPEGRNRLAGAMYAAREGKRPRCKDCGGRLRLDLVAQGETMCERCERKARERERNRRITTRELRALRGFIARAEVPPRYLARAIGVSLADYHRRLDARELRAHEYETLRVYLLAEIRDSDTPHRKYGAKLRQRRREVGLSMDDLAARVGVSHGTIFNWEKGTHKPRPEMSGLLEAALSEAEADPRLMSLEEEGAAFRRRREAKGVSLRELGRKSGVHHNTVRNYECGLQRPRAANLRRMEEALRDAG
jgi:transcriptional regulator with XRE-family HTH domain